MRWATALVAALCLHAAAGWMIWLIRAEPAPPEPDPVAIELWRPPLLREARAPETEQAKTEVSAPDRPVPEKAALEKPTTPKPSAAVKAPDPIPAPPPRLNPAISPSDRSSGPVVKSDPAGAGVTPRTYPEGGDKGRAAVTRALLKRDLCIAQRNAGRVMDKDCPVSAPRDITLPLQAPEKRPTKLCLAAREREWQKYRDGKGGYPGLRDLIEGKKKCREGWDD
ncbi:MAG: hypothetical protein QM667_08655 [Asticcacaulis sp.]